MLGHSNKRLVEQYFAEVLSGKPKTKELIHKFVDDAELEEHINFFESVFPGYTLTIDDMVSEGDKVAVRATFHGTHRGEFMGVAPTGKHVDFGLMLIYRYSHNKIVEHWMIADSVSMMQQIGAMPIPA